MTIYNADIKLGKDRVFRSQTSEGTCPEVIGWIEQGHNIVKGTYGFWRTANHQKAANEAARMFPTTVYAGEKTQK